MAVDTAFLVCHERIRKAARHAGVALESCGDSLMSVPAAEPNRLRTLLAALTPAEVIVTGTLERRLLLLQHIDDCHRWTIADLAGRPLGNRLWPAWFRPDVHLDTPSDWLTAATLDSDVVHRFTRPLVLLAALYHPEHFPLPRFPLGISDLARAARATLTGRTELMDMQLGFSLDDIVEHLRIKSPDIVGISATFGQHDLLVRLLDAVSALPQRPLVLAGGSLTVRNERLLLERYPWLLVARGAGEPTIADTLAYWHGDLELTDVRGVGYAGAPRGEGTLALGRFRRTATVANRMQTDILPELDLLGTTFEHRGVAQLEASRGCTNFCSFCPRGHKGQWAGADPESLRWIVHAIGSVFREHPAVSRTLYLVDEEFIGRQPGAVARALAVADVLHDEGFRWETSCRVDQVVRPDHDRAWHVERGHLWRNLCNRGLRRCLFGVESGVTSILARFNKETTGDANALAVRTLSALGVPTRYTYITFDQLMSADELRATHDFQARTDLILHALPELSVDEIVDGVHDDAFVAEHNTNQPFYTGVSYLLVSMECLIGAAYTKQVQIAGLGGPVRPAMGRLDADFADWRIGRFSYHAQLWVDRNFALDYTLKSVEKLLDGKSWARVRAARAVFKHAAFDLLTAMVELLSEYSLAEPNPHDLDGELITLLHNRFDRLHTRVSDVIVDLHSTLHGHDAEPLFREYARWSTSTSWQLINAADACGT